MAVYLPNTVDRDMISVTMNPSNEVVIASGRRSPTSVKENEKRVRREIANSNERRRMQSINAGFQSLRNLLPIPDGEKLSKAAILQQTTNLICRLEHEKTQLLNQIAGLKRSIRNGEGDPDSPSQKKRKRNDSLMDEGIGSPEGHEETNNAEEMQRSILELRFQLDRERQYRKALEDKNRLLEAKFYPEKIKEITDQIKQEEPVNLELLNAEQQLEMHNALAVAALEGYTDCDHNTTDAIRRNLETIYKAIRHVEGATPVQTPTPTPTPEDTGEEPEGSIRVIRQVDEASGLNDVGGIKVQLVHPLHMLATRPTGITVS